MKRFKEILQEKLKEEKETEYQKFFKKKLKEWGVESPAELDDDDKDDFFKEIDDEWDGEKEEIDEKSCKKK